MTYLAELEARVDALARRGRYQTPECAYLAARLRYIRDGDEDALAVMIRSVTLAIPDYDPARDC